MFLLVFNVFKIGIGSSSSHTMGPMTAANPLSGADPRRRVALLLPAVWAVSRLKVSLHGFLAFTGIGHSGGVRSFSV